MRAWYAHPPLWTRRRERSIAVVLTSVLAVLLSLVTVPAADAVAGPHPKVWTPPNTRLDKTRSVEGSNDHGELGTSAAPGKKGSSRWRPARRAVPTGSATVTLSAPAAGKATDGKAAAGRKTPVTRAGGLPVAVADLGAPHRAAKAPSVSSAATVGVTVHDAAASKAAGAFGNLITVRGASPRPTVDVPSGSSSTSRPLRARATGTTGPDS